MRKTITIPGAGEFVNCAMAGNSFAVELIGKFPTPSDVPVITSKPGNQSFPLYNRNVYRTENYFNDLLLFGTAESEGQTVDLYSTDECLETKFNIILAESYEDLPGTTFAKTADDTVQSLTAIELADSNGRLPKKLYVTLSPGATLGGVKFAYNTDPGQGNDTIGALLSAPGQGELVLVELEGLQWMLDFRFISAINLETQLVNFTAEY